MSATEMHDDEVRARLGLEPLGRPMTMEERITMLNLRAMPEPHDEAELVDTVASQLNPDDDAPQCGEAFDHDEEIVYVAVMEPPNNEEAQDGGGLRGD